MRFAARTVLLALTPAWIGMPLSTSASAAAQSELARCAAIAAADARLACYDREAGRAAGGDAPSADRAGVAAAPITPTHAAVSPPAQSLPVVPAPAPLDAADGTKNFGLSAAQLHTPHQGPQAIQAHIGQLIADPYGRSYVILDNGQSWASTEGEMILNSGEAVTISRAMLGSFMLTSAVSKHSYHVRRIR